MTAHEWRTVAERLAFPEAPRWREGKLYVSEIFGGRVVSIDGDGTVQVLVRVQGRLSGLGWWPDGTMIVVSMLDRSVLKIADSGQPELLADLSGMVGGDANDMVVDARGNAYVGNFGYDYAAGEERRAAVLVLVEPSGRARVVAEDVWFPNGMAVSADGRTLYLAETPAERVTAFTIEPDGSLADRRVFADLDGARPDGIALDAQGALWVASPGTGELLRVAEGSILVREPSPNGSALACALGGPDGHTLFVCCSPSHDPSEATERRGSVVARRVDVPAATAAQPTEN